MNLPDEEKMELKQKFYEAITPVPSEEEILQMIKTRCVDVAGKNTF